MEDKTSDRVLLFPHIPKTGGMSFYHQIRKHDPQYRRFGNNAELTEFTDVSLEELNQSWFISGHLYFTTLIQKGLYGPTFTLLRDPVERITSMYQYLKNSKHPDHEKFNFSSFDDFFSWFTKTKYFSNVACKFICGQENYKLAIDTIEKYSIFPCPLDMYHDSLDMFSLLLNTSFRDVRHNENDNKEMVILSQEQVHSLSSMVDQDQLLLNYCKNNYWRLKGQFINNNQDYFDERYKIKADADRKNEEDRIIADAIAKSKMSRLYKFRRQMDAIFDW